MAKTIINTLQEKIHVALFIFTVVMLFVSLDFSSGLKSILKNYIVSIPWLVFALLHITSIRYKKSSGILIALLSITVLYLHGIFSFEGFIGFFIFFAFALFQLVFGLLITISGLFFKRN